MSFKLPIVTPRIILRRLTIDDLADFQAYRHDAEVARYQGWEQTTDEEARQFLAASATEPILQARQWCQIGIAESESGKLIGDIGIHISDDERDAEIGFSLRRESQGKGLGFAAVMAAVDLIFEHTSVSHITGITDARNEASIKLLKRLGMEHIKTEEAMFRGEPCQEHYFRLERINPAS